MDNRWAAEACTDFFFLHNLQQQHKSTYKEAELKLPAEKVA